tara:strand:+ start:1511 stop:1771 length:261 start_codon:yes stop_codon:yes gene_type:complete
MIQSIKYRIQKRKFSGNVIERGVIEYPKYKWSVVWVHIIQPSEDPFHIRKERADKEVEYMLDCLVKRQENRDFYDGIYQRRLKEEQ